ncbi:MAG: hypothetical protein KA004_17680 [Verrucomicrobiales bacterium]|nr:hypothetical protein [Verrucomicrobiales bacterium]
MKTRIAALGMVGGICFCSGSATSRADLNSATWNKGDDGNWTATVVQFPSANEDWDIDDMLGAGFPHNYNPLGDFYSAEIGGGYTVTVLPLIPIAISKLTLADDSTVALVDGSNFLLQRTGADAGTVDSDGFITLDNLTGALATNLSLDGPITFTGGGTVALGGAGTAVHGNTAHNPSATLIIEDHLFRGAGSLGSESLSIRNKANGIIRADVPLERLDIQPGANNHIINEGLIEAKDGGQMRIWETAILNDGGAIHADTGSLVELHQVTLSDGTLSGVGVVRGITTVTLEGSVTNDGTYAVATGATTMLDGELSNTGQVVIPGGNFLAKTPSTLVGAGEIILGIVPGSTSVLGAVFNSGATLLNTNNLIHGGGNILVPLTNQFTVRADEPTAPLRIHRDCTNQNRLEARSGGTLNIGNGSLTTNNAAASVSAVNGTILMDTGGRVTGGTVNVDGSSRLEFANGSVTGGTVNIAPGGMVVAKQFLTNRLSGTVGLPRSALVQINDDMGLILDGAGDYDIRGRIHLLGAGTYAGYAATRLLLDGTVTLAGGGVIQSTNSSSNTVESLGGTHSTLINEDMTIRGSGQIGRNSTFLTNRGVIESYYSTEAEPGSGVLSINPGAGGIGTMTNAGRLRARSGTLQLLDGNYHNAGGSIEADHSSKVDLEDAALLFGGRLFGGGKFRVLANALYDGGTQGMLTHDTRTEVTGTLRLVGSIANSHWMRVEAGAYLRVDGPVTLSGGGTVEIPYGTSRISNYFGSLPGDALINMDNTITGAGVIQFILLDNRGTLSPGNSPGRLTVGNVIQSPAASIAIELAGSAPGQFDVLDVQGTISLAGKLKVIALPGLNVPAGSTFDVITSGGMTGAFTALDLPLNGSGQPQFSVAQVGNAIRLTALEPVTGPVPVPYAAWAVNEGLTPANNATSDDPNGDGCPNLAAYFLGLPALGGASGGGCTVVPRSSAGLTIAFSSPRTVTGVVAGTEISTTMTAGSWTPGPAPVLVEATAARNIHECVLFADDEPRKFLRLTFSLIP